MGDSQRASWTLSHPTCCEVIFSISNLADVTGVCSEQHIEISDARKYRDMKDFLTLLQFFEAHNPFDSKCVELCNIFSGLVDSQQKVTADEGKLIRIRLPN